MSDVIRRFRLVPSSRPVHCCRCGQLTRARVPVRYIPRTSGPDHVQYACPNCVPHLLPGPTREESARRA
ncbi:hypothetical protein DMH15_28105 [Streptomyces sp. WAC 06725]|nr:hypothetical protein DMH15_28105 [Streptomyces sp. WAC 06725]